MHEDKETFIDQEKAEDNENIDLIHRSTLQGGPVVCDPAIYGGYGGNSQKNTIQKTRIVVPK